MLALGRGDTPAAQCSAIWQNSGGGAAARGQCTGWMRKTIMAGGLSSDANLFGSFLARYRLSAGSHSQIFPSEKSFVKDSRQVSTSSVSRNEFFGLRSLNNLVSHLLILSKQNVLRTYEPMGFLTTLAKQISSNLLTQCVCSFARSPAIFLRGDGVRYI